MQTDFCYCWIIQALILFHLVSWFKILITSLPNGYLNNFRHIHPKIPYERMTDIRASRRRRDTRPAANDFRCQQSRFEVPHKLTYICPFITQRPYHRATCWSLDAGKKNWFFFLIHCFRSQFFFLPNYNLDLN